jgi:multidrug/hemolysin transport system permease protein
MGIYMPIGNLPDGIQWVVKLFPGSYAASALRTLLMDDLLEETFSSMPTSVPDAYELFTRADFEKFMGVNFEFGDYTTNLTTAIIVMVVTAVICCLLSILNVGKKNN